VVRGLRLRGGGLHAGDGAGGAGGHRGVPRPDQIYATDVDDEALGRARHGAYTDGEIKGLPHELRARYFEPVGGRHAFRKHLRRSVTFGRNDLVQDATISRIDLLVCRNTLMYFTAEMQARIRSRFHFALAESGVLFLGKAERLLRHRTLFQPIPRAGQPGCAASTPPSG
jgi:two-component system CheB/CheR fusion protein